MDSDSDSYIDHPLELRMMRNIRHFGGINPFGLFPMIPYNPYNEDDSEEDLGDAFNVMLRRVRQNDARTTRLRWDDDEIIQIMPDDEEWEELGRDIASNTHLESLELYGGALNDHYMSVLFRGLTRSNTIERMNLYENGFSVEGVRSMVPVLQNANNLTQLHLNNNDMQSEGCNVLFRALRDSSIEKLCCVDCGIESIEIDNDHIPPNLTYLCFSGNNINADGCRGLAKLLQGGDEGGGDATLDRLELRGNKIDDEGVAILVDALKNNTSLGSLDLRGNDDISDQGQIMLLKLVNNISSIQATLQSNHTLRGILIKDINPSLMDADDDMQMNINMSTRINGRSGYDPESVGREKVIASHLKSQTRAELAALQGIDHSLYSEIDPLHLPEVLSLIGQRHGEGELYNAVSSSIMILFSTMNRKKCIQQERAYHASKAAEHRTRVEELDAELGVIEAAEGGEGDEEIEHRSNKRRRKWWWGLWGGA